MQAVARWRLERLGYTSHFSLRHVFKGNAMRFLLAIVAVIVLLAFVGWLAFDFSDNSASVEVRTEKIESDTAAIVDKSKDLLNSATDD